VLDSVEAPRLWHILRVQDERIQDCKDNGVGANGQGQRQNGGDGESGRFAHHAQGESQILQQGSHEQPPEA
jgi:hypothetical protein